MAVRGLRKRGREREREWGERRPRVNSERRLRGE